MTEQYLYTFELATPQSWFPFGRTTDGGHAVYLFTSVAKAVAFADAKGHSTEWRVRQLSVLDALDWLMQEKTKNQITAVWPDPSAAEEGHKECPVDDFLAILQEMARTQ